MPTPGEGSDTNGLRTFTVDFGVWSGGEWTGAAELPAWLASDGTSTPWLRDIDPVVNDLVLKATATETEAIPGNFDTSTIELSNAWETYEAALTFEDDDGNTLVLKGPNHADNSFSDPTNSYFWTPDVAIADFFLDATGRNLYVTFRDGEDAGLSVAADFQGDLDGDLSGTVALVNPQSVAADFQGDLDGDLAPEITRQVRLGADFDGGLDGDLAAGVHRDTAIQHTVDANAASWSISTTRPTVRKSVRDPRGSLTTTLAVSNGLPTTYDADGYDAVTFTECGEVTNLNEFGAEYELVQFVKIDHPGINKRKGKTNNGQFVIDLLFNSADDGQTFIEDAETSRDSYSFRVDFPGELNAERFYFSGFVTSLKRLVDGPDNSLRMRCLIEIDHEDIVETIQ